MTPTNVRFSLVNNCLILLLICVLCPSQSKAQASLIGSSIFGGEEFGLVFKTDINGNNISSLHIFEGNSGAYPFHTTLCEANNGKLYGLSSQGGLFENGVLFEYDTIKHEYRELINFNGANIGSNPKGSLIKHSNGKLYGMCSQGGLYGYGSLFEFDPNNNVLTKKLDFDGNQTGRAPNGNLTETANGKLYGMTYQGGDFNEGVIFEFNPANDSFYKKFDFDGSVNGRNPFGSLLNANNNKLYGMTYQGGSANAGILFEYDPALDSLMVKSEFNGSNGSNPYATMIQANNGLLYGMTFLGGTFNAGVLFAYDINNDSLIKKAEFNGSALGRNPYGDLLEINNGHLYGLCYQGGAANAGTLFEFNPLNDSLIKKIDFNLQANGRNPYSSLMQTSSGRLYGLSYRGGNNNFGALFEYSISGNSIQKKMDFNSAVNGKNPYGSPMQAKNQKCYGMTNSGGADNMGVLYEYDLKQQKFDKKIDFDGNNIGAGPFGSLFQADNHKLYGMTYRGGIDNYGVLFEYDPDSNKLSKKIEFDGSNFGRNPYSSLTGGENGNLYGMTPYGGVDDYGVIFKYNYNTQQMDKIFDFDDSFTGSEPFGKLLRIGNNLYGLCFQGGKYSAGVLFEFNLSNGNFLPKFNFGAIYEGSYPQGSLLRAKNGKLYGMTQQGGLNNAGTIFEFNPSDDSLQFIHHFNGLDGSNPTADLLETKDGYLYGMTQRGGVNAVGTMFEFRYDLNLYNKKLDFNHHNGSLPFGSLSKICLGREQSMALSVCDSVISPSGRYTWKNSGIFKDTISTYEGCDSIITITLTISRRSYANVTINACSTYVSPDNRLLDSSGIYTAVISNYWGCDSIITIDLNINNSFYSFDTVTCGDYKAPDGQVYSSSGPITAIITNTKGCDSIISIQLKIYRINASISANDVRLTANPANLKYQWLDCENAYAEIAGDTNRVFNAPKNGSYSVVISEDKCKDTSDCVIVSTSSMYLTTFKNKIFIYPNPGTDLFYIVIGESLDKIRVRVNNTKGKIVQLETFYNTDIIKLELNCEPGIYTVELRSGNQVAVLKLVKI